MTAEQVADAIERCDAIELLERRLRNNWLAGFAASEMAHRDDYEAGFHDGVIARKTAEHDAHRLAEDDARRWVVHGEIRTRQTFGQPHRDDFPGARSPVPRRRWLGGAPVHHHYMRGGPPCPATCYQITPGFYDPDDAAAVLEKLPSDYSEEIARLRGGQQ